MGPSAGGHTVKGHYSSDVRILSDTVLLHPFPAPTLSSCAIPLPRMVTIDQTGADLFSPLCCLLPDCLCNGEISFQPLSLSLWAAVVVLLGMGKQGNENKRTNILPNTLSHCVCLHFSSAGCLSLTLSTAICVQCGGRILTIGWVMSSCMINMNCKCWNFHIWPLLRLDNYYPFTWIDGSFIHSFIHSFKLQIL